MKMRGEEKEEEEGWLDASVSDGEEKREEGHVKMATVRSHLDCCNSDFPILCGTNTQKYTVFFSFLQTGIAG